MTKSDENAKFIDSISIKHIVNLSIVDMVMLQLLLNQNMQSLAWFVMQVRAMRFLGAFTLT